MERVADNVVLSVRNARTRTRRIRRARKRSRRTGKGRRRRGESRRKDRRGVVSLPVLNTPWTMSESSRGFQRRTKKGSRLGRGRCECCVWVGGTFVERETPSSFDPFLAETRREYESVRGWLTSWRCNVLAVLRTVGLGQRWCADGTIEGRRSRGSKCITVLPDETSKKNKLI
jgi:hypothetical protein